MYNKITALYERSAHPNRESIREQMTVLEASAKSLGLMNFTHFTDDGYSAFDDDRPGFIALCNAVDQGDVDTVIMKDLTRLSRNYITVNRLTEMLKQKGVRLITITERLDILPPHIHDDETGIEYTLHGDYYFPEILDPSLEDHRPIGKWARMHEKYLSEERPGLYARLMLSGTLQKVLADVNETATVRMNDMIDRMKRTEGVTEKLKAADQMEWVRRMNDIRHRAEETILAELIYA